MVTRVFREFLRLESAGGILLIVAALLALVMINSPLSDIYNALLRTPVEIRIGTFEIAKPLLLWINDGLMAVFFFTVGLELKREFMEGELSSLSQVMLPAVAATAGIVVPALLYTWFNYDDPVRLRGWAIPSATDIAFALGILALLGKRVPTSLKLFLMTLAILDDVGAIVIIALFYTSNLSLASLSVAGSALVLLFIMNRRGVVSIPAYILVGLVMWASVLKSGVHATLAGVALAFMIPMRDPARPDYSPSRQLEHELHPSVAFVILPLFAFANAGVPLSGFTIAHLLEPVTIGVILGLFVGKQVGVFTVSWLMVKLKWAKLPEGASWPQVYGIALLCGIGFTMSLFIASLAFEYSGQEYIKSVRLGILVASFLSALTGYLVLRYVPGQKKT
ncbi:MAG: Na+/H+ antiporter NhaA [Proteobacteria bacterium]|nr:Na+/H+ antiporter NhaA [Pseudomonadota bacterium]